jgi:hypothetical protein
MANADNGANVLACVGWLLLRLLLPKATQLWHADNHL